VRLNEKFSRMTLDERRGVPGISAQRAEIVVAGGQILEGVLESLGINMLRTCDYALREGVVIDHFRMLEAESRPPARDVADPRLLGALAVGRRFGFEEAHALQVARLAEKIFDALAADFQLTRHQRTLLSAAALLHDAGYHIAHEEHHKHSLYLIKNSELTGFSEAERSVIANVARYHRGAPPATTAACATSQSLGTLKPRSFASSPNTTARAKSPQPNRSATSSSRSSTANFNSVWSPESEVRSQDGT
jgi:exopolyphosphatase/guanosine-5'-triphosphate,3'-diphosphate pyrophosphatase